MAKYALEKSIIIGEVALGQGIRPSYRENGNYVVLQGVKTEGNALDIVRALDDNGETMTLNWRKIAGLLGTPTDRHISAPGKDTDIAYNPAKQELHIYAGAVCESIVSQRAGLDLGVQAAVFGPYVSMTAGAADLNEMKTRFGRVARVMPPGTNWYDVRDRAVADQFLAASVKAVEVIVCRSGIQNELARAGHARPQNATVCTTGLAYLDRNKL